MAKATPIQGLDIHDPTSKNASIIALARLEDLYHWHSYVDNPHNIKELHHLRIAAKRLRYTLEIFEDVLPDACKPFLKELVQIQEEIGTLHDSDVITALLQLCLNNHHTQTAPTLPDAKEQQAQFLLQPDLVPYLLDPTIAPTAAERQGLEYLLRRQQQSREEQYTTFRQHWHQLQTRDFRGQLLAILNTEHRGNTT